ncbi:hypothetical protein CT0861_05371 [Colletotrichum tofieldiae]|uniref:Uncharacterized protein n=1 Tax=Colletotrichum tofieldiae TaxID=708197 RepID=A0A166WI45_9PEZI|nr:hypothetical protein CT0861_05371 [Colletotrichum tofieldiae]
MQSNCYNSPLPKSWVIKPLAGRHATPLSPRDDNTGTTSRSSPTSPRLTSSAHLSRANSRRCLQPAPITEVCSWVLMLEPDPRSSPAQEASLHKPTTPPNCRGHNQNRERETEKMKERKAPCLYREIHPIRVNR